jgi:hypothetical protein
VGGIPTNHQSGHKAVEKSLEANFRTGPKGIFYGLVTRFSRILLNREAWWEVALSIINGDTRP